MAAAPPEQLSVQPRLSRAARSLLQPHVLLLMGIVALAVGLRLAWIAYVNPSPLDGRFDDSVFYYTVAHSLAAGRGFVTFLGEPTAQWPPGYPFLLAALFKLVGIFHLPGNDIIYPKILNALGGGLTCLLIYLIGVKVFNRRVGLLAAFLFAVFLGQIFYSTLIMTEALTPTYLSLLLLLTVLWVVPQQNPRWYRPVLLGGLFGVFMLSRGEAAVLLVMTLLLWRLVTPTWRRFAAQSGLFVAAAALVVLPWTVRNAVQMHAFVPVMSATGHTLLAGQQPDPYNPDHVFPEARFQAQYANLPAPEREIKVENASMREAIHFMIHHPVEEAYFPFVKFYNLFREDANALAWINGNYNGTAFFSAAAMDKWTTLGNGYYIALMVVAGLGIPLWFSVKDKRKLALVLFVGGWVVIHMIFIPSGRYHAPLTPIFALWAAVPLIALYDRLSTRRRRVPAEREASPSMGGPSQENGIDQSPFLSPPAE